MPAPESGLYRVSPTMKPQLREPAPDFAGALVTTLTSNTTVEEHIAAMHSRKSALSDIADMSGVAELARLDDDSLIATLRRKRAS